MFANNANTYFRRLARGVATELDTAVLMELLRYPLGFVIHPSCFGAIGDGVVDDTAALQAAIDYARHRGGIVALTHDKVYRITTPLNVHGGNVSIVGLGWKCNIQEQYPGTNLYTQRRFLLTDVLPSQHLSGSVIICDNCDGIISDDLGNGEQTSQVTFQNFALLGKNHTAARTGFKIGSPDHANAKLHIHYINTLAAHFDYGYDWTSHYGCSALFGGVRGCREGYVMGARSTAPTGRGANGNWIRDIEIDSCVRGISLYEVLRLHVSGVLAQNNETLIYTRPTGNTFVREVEIANVYFESSAPPLTAPRLFQMQNDNASAGNAKTTSRLAFRNVNVQGNGVLGCDFSDGASGSGMIDTTFDEVDMSPVSATSMPAWVDGVYMRGGKWPSLSIASARRYIVGVNVNGTYQGQSAPSGYVTDLTD